MCSEQRWCWRACLSAQGLLSVEGQSFGRQSGAGLTVLVLIAASVIILLREGGMM